MKYIKEICDGFFLVLLFFTLSYGYYLKAPIWKDIIFVVMASMCIIIGGLKLNHILKGMRKVDEK